MTSASLLTSYLRTKRAMVMSPAALCTHRQKQWDRLQPYLQRTPALASFAGRPLEAFPVVDIDRVREDYGQWNSLGLSDRKIRDLAEAAENNDVQQELAVGYSSGTGGQRGIFMANENERTDYIGQSLARLLPFSKLFRSQRLALHLRANNALYNDVSSRRFSFRHFPLSMTLDQVLSDLKAYRPTILIAPPHRLLEMAYKNRTEKMSLPDVEHLFFGSEPMSDAEVDFVAARFGKFPRPIYQATEGFLGAACQKGALHLNDHSLEIELESVPGTPGYRPIITDLRRRSQPVVRFRGDDYVEVQPGFCSCKYAGRMIGFIQGRVQDIWRFQDRVVTPTNVVHIIEGVLGAAYPWQAVASRDKITLQISEACPSGLAEKAIAALVKSLALSVSASSCCDLPALTGPKRRKVVWNDD